MQLPPDTIADFKRLYQQTCGRVLTDEEANAEALKLLRLLRLLLSPPPDSGAQDTGGSFDGHDSHPV